MSETGVRFPISLHERPSMVQAGFATHGHKKIEHYRIYCWTLHLYLYNGNLTVDGADFAIHHGHVGICPPNAKIVYRFDEKECRHFWFHFECGTDGDYRVPAMTGTGRNLNACRRAMETMLKGFGADRRMAEVKLWDLLYSLSGSAVAGMPGPAGEPLPVKQALWFIEMNLSMGVSAAQVARAAGCSHNHLNRLFLKHRGCTVKTYLLRRQMERAEYFLKRTGISVKAAAHECGVPDLQHFNKLVRRYFGKPPRAIRRGPPILRA